MTRFEMDLAGRFGDYWKKEAEKEIEKMTDRVLNGEVFFGVDMVARWKSNGRCLPNDVVKILNHTPYRDLYDEEATAKAREEEDDEFLREYRESRGEYTQEEIFEMQAAFGAGTTVVDVITGQRITL